MPIRPITPADDAAVCAIVKFCLKDAGLNQPGTAYFDPELAHLSTFYAAKPSREYVVYTDDDNTVLGGIGFAEYDVEKSIAEVQKLYLLPQARGQHAGSTLLAYCEQAAAAAGWRQLYLETHTNLPIAIHLYENHGYTRIPAPLHVGPHTTMDHFYIKKLGSATIL